LGDITPFFDSNNYNNIFVNFQTISVENPVNYCENYYYLWLAAGIDRLFPQSCGKYTQQRVKTIIKRSEKMMLICLAAIAAHP